MVAWVVSPGCTSSVLSFFLFTMAPSVAQLAPETVDAIQAAKEDIKAQEVKVDNVSAFISIALFLKFLFVVMAGTIVPILLPLL